MEQIQDTRGRTLTLSEPDILAESRLVLALGPEAAANQAYMMLYVQPCAMVTAIDGEPVAFPSSDKEVSAIMQRLGRDGLVAARKNLLAKYADDASKDGADAVKKSD